MAGTATDGAGADSAAADAPADVPVDLAAAAADIVERDERAAQDARDRLAATAGRLRDVAAWLAATGSSATRPRCLVAGTPPALAESLAASLGVGIRSIAANGEVNGDIEQALELGRSVADDEVETGTDLVVLGCGLLPAGPAGLPDDHATALVGILCGAEPVALLPRGAGAIDTAAWIRRAEWLRESRRELVRFRGRPDELLRQLADPALAVLTGLLTRLTARRTPVVLAGLPVLAVAMLLRSVAPRAGGWWQLADTAAATDPAAARAARELEFAPLLALGVTAPSAVAGLLTVPVIRASAALLGTDGS